METKTDELIKQIEKYLLSVFNEVWFTIGFVDHNDSSGQVSWSYRFLPELKAKDSALKDILEYLEDFKLDLEKLTPDSFTISKIYHEFKNLSRLAAGTDPLSSVKIKDYTEKANSQNGPLDEAHKEFIRKEESMLNQISTIKFGKPFEKDSNSYYPLPIVSEGQLKGVAYLILSPANVKEVEEKVIDKSFLRLTTDTQVNGKATQVELVDYAVINQ